MPTRSARRIPGRFNCDFSVTSPSRGSVSTFNAFLAGHPVHSLDAFSPLFVLSSGPRP